MGGSFLLFMFKLISNVKVKFLLNFIVTTDASLVLAGAHQQNPLSPLISCVNLLRFFASNLIFKTMACVRRKSARSWGNVTA